MTVRTPPAPKGLGLEARRLWRGTLRDFDLGPAELRLLEDACREVDLIERMEEALRDPSMSLTVVGSQGQPVTNPLIQEVRQHRQTVRALLGALRLPDEEPGSWDGLSSSDRARKAALARWRKR